MKIIVDEPQKTNHMGIIFKNLKLFTESITFRFSNEELHIQTLDNGQCCLLDTHIKKIWFSAYHIEPTDLTTIAVNTTILQKVFDTLDQDQSIEISLTDDYLKIHFANSKKVCDKSFNIPLIDLETDLMEPTVQESDVDLTMPTKSFITLTKQLQGFSETLKTEFTEDHIILKRIA